jgi:hypothetical protein
MSRIRVQAPKGYGLLPPMGGVILSANRLSGGEAVIELGEQQSLVSAGLTRSEQAGSRTGRSRVHGAGDHWLAWVIALAAIAVPVIVLVVVDWIPGHAGAWHGVNVSVQRGDFLVPVMILCAETIRRWWRDVPTGPIVKWMRIAATLVCALAVLVCLVATVAAAIAPITKASGSSIGEITLYCVIVAIIFGTLAVVASVRKVGA